MFDSVTSPKKRQSKALLWLSPIRKYNFSLIVTVESGCSSERTSLYKSLLILFILIFSTVEGIYKGPNWSAFQLLVESFFAHKVSAYKLVMTTARCQCLDEMIRLNEVGSFPYMEVQKQKGGWRIPKIIKMWLLQYRIILVILTWN